MVPIPAAIMKAVVCTGFAVRADFPITTFPHIFNLKNINTSRTDLRGAGQEIPFQPESNPTDSHTRQYAVDIPS